MNLNAPTKMVWYIALVLGILGILASFGIVSAIAGYAIWLVAIGWVLLLASTAMKGL